MKFWRDPLFHFVILGIALFALYLTGTRLLSSDAEHRIEISSAQVELLASNWQKRWLRPPTEEELWRMVEGQVREEVLYREAIVVGLDTNDAIVRRRMVQKMDLLSEDLALLADPSDRELRDFFQEHAQDYRLPPRLSFLHVYFSVDKRGSSAETDALALLEELRSTQFAPRTALDRGDRILLAQEYDLVSPAQVQREYGEEFTAALFELDPGWQGPIASGFGLHVVHVGDRIEGRLPDFLEVRERLVNDFNRVRKERTRENLYQGLRERYEVTVDEEAVRRLSIDPSSPGA